MVASSIDYCLHLVPRKRIDSMPFPFIFSDLLVQSTLQDSCPLRTRFMCAILRL